MKENYQIDYKVYRYQKLQNGDMLKYIVSLYRYG